MASGYTVAGRGDLDTIFRARVTAKRGDCYYTINGVDISNRYEQRQSTKTADTGYKIPGGMDLADFFDKL